MRRSRRLADGDRVWPGIGRLVDEPRRRADDAWIELEHREELVALYKHLHSHPELSFQEVETAARIAEELRKAGAEVTTGVGKLGVVGVLKNGAGADGPGPHRPRRPARDRGDRPALRQQGDRRPTTRRQDVGVMHACGHDVHMTCLVGTARWLAEHKDRWSGTVVLIGQPAEETIGGAKAMLDDGLYTRFPKPDLRPGPARDARPARPGKVGYTPGPALAGSTSVDVIDPRQGGPRGGARTRRSTRSSSPPWSILDFQTIVSREIEPISRPW